MARKGGYHHDNWQRKAYYLPAIMKAYNTARRAQPPLAWWCRMSRRPPFESHIWEIPLCSAAPLEQSTISLRDKRSGIILCNLKTDKRKPSMNFKASPTNLWLISWVALFQWCRKSSTCHSRLSSRPIVHPRHNFGTLIHREPALGMSAGTACPNSKNFMF